MAYKEEMSMDIGYKTQKFCFPMSLNLLFIYIILRGLLFSLFPENLSEGRLFRNIFWWWFSETGSRALVEDIVNVPYMNQIIFQKVCSENESMIKEDNENVW